MKQNTNHSEAAEMTAARTPKNTTTNAADTLRRRYEVSDTTAWLLDCITDVQDLYSKIIAALATKYGDVEAEAEEHSAKYLNACNALTDLLHDELKEHFTDMLLLDAKNTHADVVKI